MRSLFSVLGLVVVLAVIGLIASRQLSGVRATSMDSAAPLAGAAPIAGKPAQIPAQYKQELDAAMQTARPMEGDAK